MFDEIVNYLNYGFAVFPVFSVRNEVCMCGSLECKNPGKHSKFGRGPEFATNDIEIVKNLKIHWENSNIGVATGKISGIVVLDVDPRDCGDEVLRVLTAQNSPLPETVTTLSGGSGFHYYFKYPNYTLPTKNALRSGLDFKSDNDWVIAPTSLHKSGNRYRWLEGHAPNDIQLAEIPDWLSAIILEEASTKV